MSETQKPSKKSETGRLTTARGSVRMVLVAAMNVERGGEREKNKVLDKPARVW